MRRNLQQAIAALAVAAALQSGCTIAPAPGETQARARVSEVGTALHLSDRAPPDPLPATGASLVEYIRFAALNHPRVAAAYHDWRATVADITPASALPDPKLTFEADIADTLMTFMPGVMFDFMATGKRSAMAAEKTAGSEVARRAFNVAVVRTAADVRRAWIELAYASEAGRRHEMAIGVIEQMSALADASYATSPMMASLEKQIDLQSELAEHHAAHKSSGDRLHSARVQFKAALGLLPTDPDPAWPEPALTVTRIPSEEELWSRVLAANPELAQMRAMVDMAVAGVEVARKAGTPDFSLGLMSDLKASPIMFRPTATLSLPVWRAKISESIAAAEARREGAGANVDSAQLDMAASLARMLYMIRESDRMLEYIDEAALPNLERSAALATASYQTGSAAASMISDASLRLQMAHLNRLEVLRGREQAVTDLLLMTADVAPRELAALTGADQPTP